MNNVYLTLFIILLFWDLPATAQERPYINEVQAVHFGEILGLPGTCRLNALTKVVSDGGGSLCPFQETQLGEPGKYQIVGFPNTNIQIRITDRLNQGDGLTYTPSGVYQVFGLPDTPIIVKQQQTIATGDTGVITIVMGGDLVSAITLEFGSSYSTAVVNGITFNEVP